MITLITGAPGAGKTAMIVHMLLERMRNNAGPAFVSGVPDLKLPHEPLPPVTQWTHRVIDEETGVSRPEYSFPPHSVLVVDEAQGVFRPRSASAAVPDHVAALETHRHTGVDLWLVTQHPGLMDTNVKRLVGRHIHLRSTWLGRQLLEWSEAVSPNDRGTRSQATRSRYRLPKKVFGLYKSATAHIKPSRRVPWQLPLLVVLVFVVGFGVWKVGHRVSDAINGKGLDGQVKPVATLGDRLSGRGISAPGSGASARAVPLGTVADDYKPRLVARPETAPLYDGLRQPKTMPRTAGCMVHAGKCSCFTQQATRVDMTDAQCRGWLASPPFDPYRDERELLENRRSDTNEQKSVTHVSSLAPAGTGPFQPAWRSRDYVQPELTTANGGPHVKSDGGQGGE